MGGLKVTLDYRYIEAVQDNHRNNSFSLNFSVREREREKSVTGNFYNNWGTADNNKK